MQLTNEKIMDRRGFLAGGVAAVVMSQAKAKADDAWPPIIDTHQHLWDRSKFRLEWIEKGSILDRDFLSADYAMATQGLGVVQAVYMEVDVVPAQHSAEAKYVSDICATRSTPTRAAVISGRPDSPAFAGYLDQLKENQFVKGLRQVLHGPSTPPDHCLKPEFVKGIRELGRRGLSFEICQREADLANGVKLARMCEGTQFILDHCGNPNVKARPASAWMKAIDDLAACSNVSAKISGVIAGIDRQKDVVEQLRPFVEHVWNAFGPDRVVFGGDWPVCLLGGSYKQWVTALRQIAEGRSRVDQRKLFHDNAVRIYRLA